MFSYIGKGSAPSTPPPASPALGVDSVSGVLYANTGAGAWATSTTAMPSANVDLTAQAAAITATTAFAVVTAGFYEVSWEAKVTTVDTTSCVLGPFQVKFTDATDSAVVTAPAAGITGITSSTTNTTTGGMIGSSMVVYAKAGTNIQYIMGYTGVTGDMRYALHVRVRYISS